MPFDLPVALQRGYFQCVLGVRRLRPGFAEFRHWPANEGLDIEIVELISLPVNSMKGCAMANVTVRNLPDAVHRALRVRAAHHGRSTEAEIRDILESAVRPAERVRLGSMLASIAREAGGLTDSEAEGFNRLRDRAPAEPMDFE